MLQDSVLGAVYRAWGESWIFSLLRCVWRALCGLASESRVFRIIFGPSRGDALWSDTLAARGLRAGMKGLTRLLRPLAGAVTDSAAARLCSGSALVNYDFLFGAFCCGMFLVPHEYWNNAFALIGALVFLAFYLLQVAEGRRRGLAPDAPGLGLALLLLGCLLSMLFTPTRGSSLRILFYFITSLLLCYEVMAYCQDRQSLRRLLAFLYFATLAMSLMAIAQRALGLVHLNASFTDPTINEGVPGRVYGTVDNPNNLSGILQMFLPLSAAFAGGAKRGWKRTLLSLGLLIPALALLMTYSRSGWLAIMLAAAIWVFYRNKRLLPALAVLAVLAVPLLPHSVLTRFSTIFNNRDTSRDYRIRIWRGVLAMLRDRGYWITGIGMGPDAFQYVFRSYGVNLPLESVFHSQMLYLEIDMEVGIAAALGFFWMLLKLLGRSGRAICRPGDRRERLVLIAGVASVCALAVSAIVEYLWFYPRCMFAFFLFLGLIMAAVRMEEKP